MADGYRHYGAASGQQQYYYQQQARHLARNGSPVNHNNRTGYNQNDTPSPSRSPVSQGASSFSMFNPNQAQNGMMNGSSHQRFMMGVNQHNKYGHHQQQQHGNQPHHTQQNHHHHQQNHQIHANHQSIGHQHSYSGSTQFNGPNYNTGMQNGGLPDDPPEIDESLPEHWQAQLQALADSRQNHGQSHRHSRKGAAILTNRTATQSQNDDTSNGEPVERNRAAVVEEQPRQDWEGMDLCGQGLRSLSVRIFQDYAFLTRLYVDNNRLPALPLEISELRHLEVLQASCNMIQEIPKTIGMLSRLKELLLFDNEIRTLPSEIGFLFNLSMLGIEGNPLDHDTKQFLIENGPQQLVAQLRDNSEPGPLPRPREMHILDTSETQETVTILSHNILCNRYATRQQYKYTPAKALSWEYRRDLVFEEIRELDADIVCLQEIDQENFQEFFSTQLALLGFKGLFNQKSRARTMNERDAKLVDGCAIFWRVSKYILLEKQFINFANTAINRKDMKGEHDIFNRVMPRDNVALCAFFENRQTGSRLIISNAHLHWDVKEEDVKVVQAAILLEHLKDCSEKWSKMSATPIEKKKLFQGSEPGISLPSDGQVPEPGASQRYSNGTQIPMILCGDLNSMKDSPVYKLITHGELSKDIREFQGRSYGDLTRDGITHPFQLKDAHLGDGGNDYITLTNYTWNFQAVIEYLFHTPTLRRRKLLGDIDFDHIRTIPGFPNWHFPSDHLTLFAEFAVDTPKQKTKVEANFGAMNGRR